QLFSTFHMFFQFKSELLGSIVLWFNTGLILFKYAHVLSYIVIIVRLMKDLNAVSIIFSFQIGNILILLVVTSRASSIRSDMRPSFARRSALSFHIFELYSLTLTSSSLISFVLQQSRIWLIKL